MTNSTQRARHASTPKSAVRQRTKKTRASESPKTAEELFVKTDITPEQFFQAWSREELESLIELLIESLDTSDDYTTTEMEEDGADPSDATVLAQVNPAVGYHEDDEPSLGAPENHPAQYKTRRGDHIGDQTDWAGGVTNSYDREEDTADDEPSLGSLQPYGEWSDAVDQRIWSHGAKDDREDDPGCDDREPSLCGIHADDGPGGGHDHEQDDSDMEPSLGWTSEEAARGRTCAGTVGRCFDLEEDAGDEAESDPAENGIGDHDGLLEQVAGHYPGYGCIGFARAVIYEHGTSTHHAASQLPDPGPRLYGCGSDGSRSDHHAGRC